MTVDYMGSLIDPLAKVQQGQDYVNKIAAYGTQRQAGSQYASGDYRGASQTLARGGDIAGAEGVRKAGVEQFQAQHKYIQQAAPVFQAALQQGGPQAVIQAFQRIVPDLHGMGASEEQIAEWGKRFQTDPAGTVQMLATAAQVEYKYEKVGNTLYVFDARNPRTPVGMFEGSQPDKFVVIPQGADLARVGGGGAATQVPIGQPQPTGGASPPFAPAGGGAAPAPDVGAPVPIPQPAPVPQTAAAPVVAPQPPRPAAGAVQPLPSVAMAPDPQPPRPGIPPPDAVALGLPNPEGALPHSPSRATAGGLAPSFPEGAPAQAIPGSGVEIVARGRTKPPTGTSGFSTGMTPDAVDYAANQYMLTGRMPPLGAGAAGARAQIIARAAQIAKERGLSFSQIAGSQAERTANASSLTAITKYTNMAEGFAETMRKAANYATTLLDKGAAQSGSPLVNRGIQWWRTNVKGDPDVAAFNTAVNTLTTEYAKVMTGNTGAAGATEGAREHARELLNTAQTPAQFLRAVEVLNTEVRLRRESLLEQAAALREALNTAGQSTSHRPATTAPAQPTRQPSPSRRQPTLDELLRKYGQ